MKIWQNLKGASFAFFLFYDCFLSSFFSQFFTWLSDNSLLLFQFCDGYSLYPPLPQYIFLFFIKDEPKNSADYFSISPQRWLFFNSSSMSIFWECFVGPRILSRSVCSREREKKEGQKMRPIKFKSFRSLLYFVVTSLASHLFRGCGFKRPPLFPKQKKQWFTFPSHSLNFFQQLSSDKSSARSYLPPEFFLHLCF